MNNATQDITVKLRDHVTFDTYEDIQAGYATVAAIGDAQLALLPGISGISGHAPGMVGHAAGIRTSNLRLHQH
ncbi:hypothetical protein V8G57_09185 [Collimonas sp. H4R21]|uniref:Uncharacterized protein n=1 Tax=Collimonas rhizosphaerae TaxID=3126357 RepID=A0ABU9PU93_9BURK